MVYKKIVMDLDFVILGLKKLGIFNSFELV